MKVKLFVMDVDGTLTDGLLYLTADGEAMKIFHAQDGGAIKELPREGVTTAIITGRSSGIVQRRAKELGITQLRQEVSDKLGCLQEMAQELGVTREQIAYIGDDTNDLACIRWCGFSACPADAVPEVLAQAKYICSRNGGRGAVREFIAWLRKNA